MLLVFIKVTLSTVKIALMARTHTRTRTLNRHVHEQVYI